MHVAPRQQDLAMPDAPPAPDAPFWKRLAGMVGLILLQIALFLLLAVSIKRFVLVPLFGMLPFAESTTRTLRHLISIPMVLGIYALVAGRMVRRGLPELSLRRFGLEAGGGFVAGAASMGAILGVLALLGYFRVETVGSATALPGILVPVVLLAMTEELLFRGILFRNLERVVGTWPAMVGSAVIFGALHVTNAHADLVGLLSATLGGLLVCAAYSLTGRLWLPILFHAGWNLIQPVFGVVLSGNEQMFPVFMTSRLDGPTALTGGAFGPEGSILAIGLVAALFLLGVWRLRARGPVARPVPAVPA